jgi:hypothetical protein
MNKEDAIEVLKENYPKGKYSTELSEAYDIAIRALEYFGCGCSICLTHNNMKCPKLINCKEREDKYYEVL